MDSEAVVEIGLGPERSPTLETRIVGTALLVDARSSPITLGDTSVFDGMDAAS